MLRAAFYGIFEVCLGLWQAVRKLIGVFQRIGPVLLAGRRFNSRQIFCQKREDFVCRETGSFPVIDEILLGDFGSLTVITAVRIYKYAYFCDLWRHFVK